MVLGGRRVKVQRPRARTAEGREVHLDTYATFAADDVLSAVVMERMLAGLAGRRHRAANEPVGAKVEAHARSTSKSSVSRRFVAKTKKALEELMARDLSDLEALRRRVAPAVTPSCDMRERHRKRSGRHRTPTGFGTSSVVAISGVTIGADARPGHSALRSPGRGSVVGRVHGDTQ